MIIQYAYDLSPWLHLMYTGRRFDPNMPPSYDQAVSGRDKSLIVEEGTASVPINIPTNEENIPPPEYIKFGNNEDQRPLLT